MNLDDFAKRLRRISDGLPKNVDQLMRDVATEVEKTLVEDTPRDTGRAVSNWRMSKGQPLREVVYPEPSRPPSPAEGAERALAEARDVLSTYTVEDGPIFITNSVPYIGALNDGHSKQAPRNFVQKAVAAGKARIAKSESVFVEVTRTRKK